jgi:hypothetical protein
LHTALASNEEGEMPRFTGKLLRDGAVVLNRVEGSYKTGTTPDGFTNWGGTFTPAVDLGEYTLVLDDGSSGSIRVLGVSSGSGRATVANFKGNGPPPA